MSESAPLSRPQRLLLPGQQRSACSEEWGPLQPFEMHRFKKLTKDGTGLARSVQSRSGSPLALGTTKINASKAPLEANLPVRRVRCGALVLYNIRTEPRSQQSEG